MIENIRLIFQPMLTNLKLISPLMMRVTVARFLKRKLVNICKASKDGKEKAIHLRCHIQENITSQVRKAVQQVIYLKKKTKKT